jgi:hypothetical protein
LVIVVAHFSRRLEAVALVAAVVALGFEGYRSFVVPLVR